MNLKEPNSEPPDESLGLDLEILKKAQEGDSFALLDVGKAYYCYTSNQSDNCEKAFRWFMLSAEQNNMEAQFRLGDMYAFGHGVGQSEVTAYDYYLQSALQGYPKALTRINNLYHNEKSMYCRGQRDSKEAEWTTADFKKKNNIRELNEYRVKQLEFELTKIIDYFMRILTDCRELIDDDDQEDKQDAYLKLGFLYQHGYGIRKIRSRAIEFYTLAAEKGNADAAYNLGHIYHHNPRMKWNYREAFKWYTKAVEKGHIYAHNGLGFLYLKGLGTDTDHSKAIFLYTEAAKNRHINAMITLATIFRKGDIVKQDHKKAVEWYRKAIMEGSTVAQNSLETLYNNEKLSENKYDIHQEKKSTKLYSKKGLCSRLRLEISTLGQSFELEKLKKLAMDAMKGDGHAMFEIGIKYYNGDGFAQDKDIAFRWIKNAAKAGLTNVQCIIAKMYKDGDCVEQNYHKASVWYGKAAKNRDSNAQYSLGNMYYDGLGVRKDPLEASRCYTFAADKNNSDAQCQLGVLRVNGEGLRQDMFEAFKWFDASARQKNPQAVYRLATMYEHGNFVKSNFDLALSLFQNAAQRGSLDAQLKLAKIYDNDHTQCHDKNILLKYYKMAANQGNPEAKYRIAIMYLDGQGVDQNLIQAYYQFKESRDLGYEKSINLFTIPIDYSKSNDINFDRVVAMFALVCRKRIDSLEYNLGCHYSREFMFSYNGHSYLVRPNNALKELWYEMAAEKDHPKAQYKLAIIYEERNNLPKSIEYYRKAHRLGNIDATYKLACLYMDGYGVSQNLHKAFCLFSEASDKGHREAYKVLNPFGDNNQNKALESIQKMFQVSAESGCVISQYKLGILVLDTKSPLKCDVQEAEKWLKMASNGGYIEASYRLAMLFENGINVVKNYQEIIRLYRAAADKGHEKALFRLAQLYHFGDNIEEDYLTAFQLYTLAALQGYQPAQLAINVTTKALWEINRSQLNKNVETLRLNYASCLRMWKNVAEKGNRNVQYGLGIIYDEHNGDENIETAARWYSRAASASHADASYQLGKLYEIGRGVKQDYRTAIKFYEQASRLNHHHALYQLGVIYQDGKGVETDLVKAHDYYKRASQKGNHMAQFTLGRLYEEGSLLPQNKLEALKWYSTSFSQGNKDAEDWLATYYDEDYSIDSFYHRKFDLFSRIVKQGHSEYQQSSLLMGSANYELGMMYYHGYGTAIDYKHAWECFSNAFKFSSDNKASEILTIKYEPVDILIKDSYLKKLEMFEAVVERLSAENIYELGSIYYHGICSTLEDSHIDGTQRIIVQQDFKKASRFFKLITKRDSLDAEGCYMYCSYYLGMMYFVDIKRINDSSKSKYYLANALKSGMLDSQPFLDYINSDDKIDTATVFKKVMEWHEAISNSRDAKLIFNIGWMYSEGCGTEQDYAKSKYHYEKAANQDYDDAYVGLGNAYEHGLGVKQDYKTAIDWYKKAAKKNNIIANYNLGNIYYDGEGVEKDYTLAFQYFKVAADLGHSDSQNTLGMIYRNGYCVEKNYRAAIAWYTKAASQNNVSANYSLGNIYYYGNGVEKDYKLAIQYYRLAADKRDSRVQNKLGIMYENGYGVEKSYTIAIEWYAKAASQNNVFANYNLGNMYFYSKGVEKNYMLAFQYYTAAAANKGDRNAQNQLGVMYENGYGVEQNYTTAIQWYTKSAIQNDGFANYNLGNIYYYGNGVGRNYTVAFQFYKVAADQGDSNAQNQLGVMYGNGYGVEQNYASAIEWYTKSANQSDGFANYNLGNMYFYGKGVEKNYALAFQYYNVAVDQGDSNAQIQLAEMYYQGLGIDRDYEIAISLLSRASQENNDAVIALGEMYHTMNNEEQNFSKAFECYQNVNDDGNNKGCALRCIGLLYEHGDGVEKNYKKAYEYYRQSADRENKGAYYNIALLYYHGKGVDKSFNKAFEWFHRVIKEEPEERNTHVIASVQVENNNNESGPLSQNRKKYAVVSESIIYGEAHYYLGMLYNEGKGMDKNLKKALSHFEIASMYGVERSQQQMS